MLAFFIIFIGAFIQGKLDYSNKYGTAAAGSSPQTNKSPLSPKSKTMTQAKGKENWNLGYFTFK